MYPRDVKLHAFGIAYVLASWAVLTATLTIAWRFASSATTKHATSSYLGIAVALGFLTSIVQIVCFAIAQRAGMFAQYGLGIVTRILVLALLLHVAGRRRAQFAFDSGLRFLLVVLAVSVITVLIDYALGFVLTAALVH
jgi:hypothetical protein